jgi:hypothetical protein
MAAAVTPLVTPMFGVVELSWPLAIMSALHYSDTH